MASQSADTPSSPGHRRLLVHRRPTYLLSFLYEKWLYKSRGYLWLGVEYCRRPKVSFSKWIVHLLWGADVNRPPGALVLRDYTRLSEFRLGG